MPRRLVRNITGIRGEGHVDATEVWRVLECATPGCSHLMKLSEDHRDFPGVYALCPQCNKTTGPEYILRAPRWKYCRVCEWLQPIGETVSPHGTARGKTLGSAFDYHKPTKGRAFRSERQLECKTCKRWINRILNPKRTADQHREASQKRRLYALIAGSGGKLDSEAVFNRFEGKCFKCGKQLKYKSRGTKDYAIDHTLPASLFWPLASENATLLCSTCNNEKHDRWPRDYYSEAELRRLSVLTGIPYALLAGEPRLNPDAVSKLLLNVDAFLADWIKYPEEIKRIRTLVHQMESIDIKEHATNWPRFLD